MIFIKDISELTKDIHGKLKNDLSKELDKIGNYFVLEVQNNIDAEVYHVYNPKVYERTGNLKKSITHSSVDKNSDSLIIDIYADDDIAKSHHMNNPTKPLESYPEIVESGQGYDFPFEYNGEARRYMGKTVEENEDTIVKIIGRVVEKNL